MVFLIMAAATVYSDLC